jgi:phosphatidylserine/phosphatidylglycerophosphate/cardiolipin synthase-like enzyme
MPLIRGINGAKRTVEIVIFRFNRSEIEKALAAAVARGVHVHALIAYTNHGGEQTLRALETRLLAAGVSVSRTADDLVRYHGKFMIIDRRVLYLLAFNFTYLDMERSRSFGIVTTNKKHVEQAGKLFDADIKRQPYTAGSSTFVVSPVNARQQLHAFIKGARKQLLIYDPDVSDPAIVKLLEARARAGVDIRIIGKLKANSDVLTQVKALHIRLHTRSILRDGSSGFVGSQSLRALELDARREVGVIFRDAAAVNRLLKTFESDWEMKEKIELDPALPEEMKFEEQISVAKVAKKVAKAVAEDLGPVKPVVELMFKELTGTPEVPLDPQTIETTVKEAVKDAVRQVVRDFVEEATTTETAGTKA